MQIRAGAQVAVDEPYILIRDEKAQNTDGGTFTSGARRTRVLNTEVVDTDGLASLASNQITLQPGTYRFKAWAQAYNCGRHKLWFVNVTDATEIEGSSSYGLGTVQIPALVEGRFTISAPKVFELQHQCETTSTILGFGVAGNFDVEIFAQIELWKEVNGLYSAAANLDHILIQDQKAQNTAAGAFTSGAWRTRTLNTEVTDTGSHASLSSNQIVLLLGTYSFLAHAQALQTSSHQLRLQNITSGTTIATGVNAYANVASTVANLAVISGRFTLSATTTIELQHRCATSGAFGDPCNFGIEVYAEIQFWREPDSLSSHPIQAPPAYIYVRDEKAQNTAGGTFTSGAWRTRDLNTEVVDTESLVAISSNQLVLQPSTYRCRIKCPVWNVNAHQTRLQNITDGTTVLVGSSGFAGRFSTATVQAADYSEIIGRFTITATKTLEVQHQCQTTEASDGFGVPSNFAVEVYTQVELWREGN